LLLAVCVLLLVVFTCACAAMVPETKKRQRAASNAYGFYEDESHQHSQ
jgi:hypothetical protein